MTAPISVAIVEDQRLTREGLVLLVDQTPGFHVTGSFASMEEAIEELDRRPVDLVLTDLGLPGMSGVEGVRTLKSRHPDLKALVLTVYDDNAHVFEAICAGASGYLLKDTPAARLREALRETCENGAPMSPDVARKVIEMFRQAPPAAPEDTRLSPRERELMQLLADGHSYKTAADALGISMDTVRFHIRNTYDKLHVHSKSEAVLKLFKQGLLR
jgi:DNA-binding NarL/FixJ family response regulator